MTSKMKESLEAIIDVSRQLLSQLKLQKINTITSDNENVLIDNLSINVEKKQLSNEQLLHLSSERQSLITQLFDTYTQEQLSVELVMINELVSLDAQLTASSQSSKQALGQQVAKFKKSNTVRELYKKY